MIKQVIVARTKYPDGKGGTFGIRAGKLASQVAHASMKVFFDRRLIATKAEERLACRAVIYRRANVDGATPEDIIVDTTAVGDLLLLVMTPEMKAWEEGIFTKVVLGLVEDTEENLLRVHAEAKARGLPTALITDVGATEFKGVPTHTAVAIGPAEAAAIDAITGPEGIVRCRLL